MWILNRVLPRRNRLIIGCGLNHNHCGVHAQTDTVDTDPKMNPDIKGSITDSVMNHSLFRKYKYILLECLPSPVYEDPTLYSNLNYLRCAQSTIIILSPPKAAFAKIHRQIRPYGWSTKTIFKLEDIPPHLYEDDMYRNHLNLSIKTSPFPSLIISSL